jgi:hypothetical protein
MNQRIATLKLRGAALVVSGGVVIGCLVPGCGGDDTVIPPTDSGADVTTPVDSGGGGMDAPVDVGTSPPDTGAVTDAPADRVVEASVDAPVDAPADSRVDATSSDAGDAGHADAADATPDVVAEAAAPPAPLMMCPVFDTNDFWVFDPNLGGTPLTDPNPDTNAGTRALAWGTDVAVAYATALSNDCRTNGITAAALGGGSGTTAYLQQIGRFTVDLMGCGDSMAGAITYEKLLVPASSHVFTVADANVMTEIYVNAVLSATTTDWADTFLNEGMTPSPQPLTVDQFNLIQGMVEYLQSQDTTLNKSTTVQTINTCAQDAGAEGGTTSGDAGDAGAADATND